VYFFFTYTGWWPAAPPPQSGSAVQTPGFSPPAENSGSGRKFPALAKFVKIQNLMEILHFKVEALSLFLILTLHMNISYYVCGKPAQYQWVIPENIHTTPTEEIGS
jgi:hypothetical protein